MTLEELEEANAEYNAEIERRKIEKAGMQLRIAELETRCKEVAHAYDVTFKRRTELELALVELLAGLDAEFGAWRVDANWPKLRELAKT